MKKILWIALCSALVLGCKGSSSQVTDLNAKVDDLTHRVKFLEDDLLKADKQLVQQQQAMQQMHDQLREMQTYFDKLQYQSTTTH